MIELAEKIETALVAYLQTALAAAIAAQTLPDYFDPATQILPGETDEDVSRQYVRCRAAEQAENEYPPDSGNVYWIAEVETRTPVALQTTEANSQVEMHKAVAGAVESAIYVDDLAAQLTAATADFTVIAVQDRRPRRFQEDDTYSSGWAFRFYCCSTAL